MARTFSDADFADAPVSAPEPSRPKRVFADTDFADALAPAPTIAAPPPVIDFEREARKEATKQLPVMSRLGIGTELGARYIVGPTLNLGVIGRYSAKVANDLLRSRARRTAPSRAPSRSSASASS